MFGCVHVRSCTPQECVVNAAAGGLDGLKLYGMVGLPGEDEEDVHATIDMMAQVGA